MYNEVSRNGGHIISAGSRLCEVYPIDWIMTYCWNLTRLHVTLMAVVFNRRMDILKRFTSSHDSCQWCTPSFHGTVIDIQVGIEVVSVAYGLRA